MFKRIPRLRAGVVIALVLVGASVLGPSAGATQPECKAINQTMDVSYNSKAYGDPLGTAIAQADPSDTIKVIGTCHGNFLINKNLTLTGRPSGAFEDTLDGSGFSGSVLVVNSGPYPSTDLHVEIENLAITHGSDSGIVLTGYVGPEVTLKRVAVSDNGGSGIAMSRSAATLIDSTVSDNGGGGLHGEYSQVTLMNSVVSGNASDGFGGTRFAMTLTRSRVSGNDGVGILIGWVSSAHLTDSFVSGNGGGGVSVSPVGWLDLNASTISDNGGPGIKGVAGGLVSLTDSTVSGNTTSGSGGGINGYATLVNSTVTGNSAALDGGGISGGGTLTGSTVTGNTAGRYGGGIYAAYETTLADSRVVGNTAGTAGGGIFGPGTTVLNGTSTACGNTPDDWPGCSP